MKNIWCIRHGTALHNLLFKQIGTKAYTSPIYRDTTLVEKGHKQSIELGEYWNEKNTIEVVFVSPLTRTLQTAHNIFKNTKMIANDDILEYPQSLDYCNKRRDRSALQIEFPDVIYDIPEKSIYWREIPETETRFQLKERSDRFKDMLKKRPEKNICVVSHSTFLKEFLLDDIGNICEELEHCKPYLFKL
jgi:broad specificity phosphatase PhoE